MTPFLSQPLDCEELKCLHGKMRVSKKKKKKRLKIVVPRYEIPSCKYFSDASIPWLYSDFRDKIQHKTQSDLWCSHKSEPHLSRTIHFNHDRKLCNACLKTKYFPEDHTGEPIVQDLRGALECCGELDPAVLWAQTSSNHH